MFRDVLDTESAVNAKLQGTLVQHTEHRHKDRTECFITSAKLSFGSRINVKVLSIAVLDNCTDQNSRHASMNLNKLYLETFL